MWKSVVRILLMITLVYGLFRAAPLIVPSVGEVVKNSGVTQGAILGKATDYVNDLLGNEVDDPSDEETENIVDELITKTRETVTDKVQEEADKVKEGVKDATNEQFCKTILKTLKEECGKYYCE